MPVLSLFPTLIHFEDLEARSPAAERFRASLCDECYKICGLDSKGHRWSEQNFPGAYTSYASYADLHQRSSTFMKLKKKIDRHVRRFTDNLEWNLKGHKLEMVTCWINIVPPGSYHSLHLHPLSALSGSYYLKTPRGGGKFKIEDPRLSKMMAAPPRRPGASRKHQNFVKLQPRPGRVLLFESWLRHEVEQNLSEHDRLSISFNYNWF